MKFVAVVQQVSLLNDIAFAQDSSRTLRERFLKLGARVTDAFRMGRPMFAVCMALAGLAAGGLGLFGSIGVSGC
jgi:hypothetical protein